MKKVNKKQKVRHHDVPFFNNNKKLIYMNKIEKSMLS